MYEFVQNDKQLSVQNILRSPHNFIGKRDQSYKLRDSAYNSLAINSMNKTGQQKIQLCW